MDLKIIHNKHSNYFFLLTIFLCLLQFLVKLNTDQIWVYLTCFFLIITIGVAHGGLDNLKGKKLFNKLKLKNNFSIFYLAYSLIAILILILWFNFGQICLWAFLIVASYHFGKEDTPDNLISKGLPQEFINQANKELSSINIAYDKIKRSREIN